MIGAEAEAVNKMIFSRDIDDNLLDAGRPGVEWIPAPHRPSAERAIGGLYEWAPFAPAAE